MALRSGGSVNIQADHGGWKSATQETARVLPEDFHDHVLHAGKAAKILLDRYFDRLETILGSLEVSTTLDVGCGKGYITNFIDEMNGYSPLGLDYSIEKIRFARKEHPTLSLARGDGTRLPFADGSIDLVIATEVLEHQEEPDRMIAEMSRVTRNCGFFTVPNEPLWQIANFLRGKHTGDWGNSPGHLQHWGRKAFEKLLSNYFEDVRVDSVFVWNFAVCTRPKSDQMSDLT